MNPSTFESMVQYLKKLGWLILRLTVDSWANSLNNFSASEDDEICLYFPRMSQDDGVLEAKDTYV